MEIYWAHVKEAWRKRSENDPSVEPSRLENEGTPCSNKVTLPSGRNKDQGQKN